MPSSFAGGAPESLVKKISHGARDLRGRVALGLWSPACEWQFMPLENIVARVASRVQLRPSNEICRRRLLSCLRDYGRPRSRSRSLLRRKLEIHERGGGALGGVDPQNESDGAEQARLMGKMAVVKTKEICGPRPFACARPQYKLTDYGVDMIFQCAFDEMQHASKKADAKALAASLGSTVKQAARSISTSWMMRQSKRASTITSTR
jgi:hypothetical protein